jgi:hypothetical protein
MRDTKKGGWGLCLYPNLSFPIVSVFINQLETVSKQERK